MPHLGQMWWSGKRSALLPLALPPLLSIPISLPVHSSPLPPSFLELMGLKASSSSLLKHAFNLIIYYLLFSVLQSSKKVKKEWRCMFVRERWGYVWKLSERGRKNPLNVSLCVCVVCKWVIVCVTSVYCVCVTGEAQLVFVILIEAPQLSIDSLCCTQDLRLRFKPKRTNTLTYQIPPPHREN